MLNDTGMSVNIADRHGTSLLDLAAEGDLSNMVEILLAGSRGNRGQFESIERALSSSAPRIHPYHT